MTLKNYIGLKFIWTILFLVLAYFSTIHVGNKYEELKKENKELQEQKKYYEQILKLKPENIEGKKNLYDYIQVSDHYLKEEKSENSPEFGTYILIMLFSYGFYFTVYNFLTQKIQKLKLESKEATDDFL
ncbi:hypothetical protein [Flavobacterium sp.]|jgi:hypothetical protein|uniref:hypothetical protein n=1 Tax=Flavobacterium sp. TaxID=239 RepID=UPI0037BF3100